jgi:Phage tail tube protein
MATTNRIGGILSIRVDGNQYEARGNFRVRGMVVRRTGVAGQDAVHGYIEEPIVPSIAGDWSIGNQLSISALEAITDSTAQCLLANGMLYVLSNCWTANQPFEIDAHDGKVEITLEGMTMTETTSSG